MNFRSDGCTWLLKRRILIPIALAFLIALPAMTAFSPLFVRPAHADHDGLWVDCPGPIPEGNTATMRYGYTGRKLEWVYAFSYIVNHANAANESDFAPFDGAKFKSKSGSTQVYVPVETNEDTFPEPNEVFAVGHWDAEQFHGCLITIVDDDMPEIARVEITSKPVTGLFYRYGESIDVTITLTQEVEVAGTPQIALFVGGGEAATWRGAGYHSGSGSNRLTFRYRVQAGDIDHDGLSIGAGATNEDRTPAYGFSGNIYAKGTKAPIDYAHDGIKNSSKHLIDGRPYVKSNAVISAIPDGWQAYRANQIIELAFHFNTAVVVEGNVTATMLLGLQDNNWEEARREAQYLHGSGSEDLVFGYTVQPGDVDRRGIGIAAGHGDFGFNGSGSIKAKGTNVAVYPHYLGKDHYEEHRVDAVVPTLTSLVIESRPSNGQAYVVGETIRVAAAFSEKVTITGEPTLSLDIGGATRLATIAPDAPRSTSADNRRFSDRIVFQYQVAEGDADSDGIGIDANSLKLNGGGVYDWAGNAAGISHTAIAASSNQ